MEYDDQKKLALQIFKGKKYAELRKAIKNRECKVQMKTPSKLWVSSAGRFRTGFTDEIKTIGVE